MSKVCLQCKEPIQGRPDKKFCSDYCRNAYNNEQNKDSTSLIRNTNNRLRKNWRVLNTLNTKGKTTVSRKKLLDESFDFQLFTGIYTTKEGRTYHLCYDQGYLELENDYYLLVKWE